MIKADPIIKHIYIKIYEEILFYFHNINRFVNTKFLKIISALRFSIFFIREICIINSLFKDPTLFCSIRENVATR